MKIYGNNLIDITTVISGTEQTGYTFENLYDNNLFPPYRSATDTEVMVLDFGSAKTFDYIALGGHNLTNAATVLVEWNSSNSWTSPAGSTSLTYDANVMVKEITPVTYRYVRITITDTANPDNWIEVEKLSIGEFFTLGAVEPGFDFPIRTSNTKFYSPTGQIYGSAGVSTRTLSFKLYAGSYSSMEAINDFFRDNEDIRTFFLAIYEDSISTYPLIHCAIMDSEIGWRHTQYGEYEATIGFQEVK